MRKFLCIIFATVFCVFVMNAQTYEDMVKKSFDYSDVGDWSAAEECLKAAMRLEPAHQLNYALLTNLGTLQRRQKKYDEALVSYSAALNQHPNDELILSNRAELYTEMHESDKALYDYNTLIELNPKNEQALYDRGILYINTGNLLLAQSDFDKILEINKETFLGRFGYAIFEKTQKNYDKSETILNYLIDKFPENMRVYEERAELYYLTSRNNRAMADINRVFLNVKEPTAEMYMLRGRIRLAQKEKEPASADFKRALELGYDKATVEKLTKKSF